MKSRMLAFMAMAFAMGGYMPDGMTRIPSSPQPRPRNLSDEELAKMQDKFIAAITSQNAERKIKHPKFKEFEINGISIIAFSQKNAQRDFEQLLRTYNLKFVTSQTSEKQAA